MTLNGTETRWHMSSAQTPDITVPPASYWSNTALALRRTLIPTMDSAVSNQVYLSISTPANMQGNYYMGVQLVSPPLPGPQTVGTRISKGTLIAYTSAAAQFYWNAYFYRPSNNTKISSSNFNSPDGATDGSPTNTVANSRALVVDLQTRNSTARIENGDRFVLELGFAPTTTAVTSFYFQLGYTAGLPDFAYGSGLAAGPAAWVALDQDLYQTRALMPNAGKMRPRFWAPGVAR